MVLSQRNLSPGVALLILGLAKKSLLADPLSPYVATVYGAAAKGMAIPSLEAWLGTIAFALQIYFDFSAYSDMALGLALWFGVRFPVNFDSPYQAASIAEFWQRWHISLSRFLREYVYIPLGGGNRQGLWRQCGNVMATMLLSGLWHGAGWMFVAWGCLHGCYLVIQRLWKAFRMRLGWSGASTGYRFAAWILTTVAVLVSWVFFRASSWEAVQGILGSMVGWHGWTLSTAVTDPASGLLALVGAA